MKTLMLLLSLITQQAPAQPEPTEFLVIVFDTSGSMGEHMRAAGRTRMEVAQDALIEVLSDVPETTHIGILTFDGWAYDLQRVDREALRTAIRKCRPGGGTPLYAHIKTATTRLLKEREKRRNLGSYKLLVVTDGEAQDNGLNNDSQWQDGSVKLGVLKDVMSRGVIVDAIGLEMSENHDLKKRINGFYLRGDDQDSLKQGLRKAVAEVGFNNNNNLAEEAFKELEGVPDLFAKTAIKGLTEMQNHPIGEMAPIKVVLADGTVVEQPNPAGVEAGSNTMLWVMGIGLLVVVVGFFCVMCIKRKLEV